MNFNQKNIFTFYSYFSFINKKIVIKNHMININLSKYNKM